MFVPVLYYPACSAVEAKAITIIAAYQEGDAFVIKPFSQTVSHAECLRVYKAGVGIVGSVVAAEVLIYKKDCRAAPSNTVPLKVVKFISSYT